MNLTKKHRTAIELLITGQMSREEIARTVKVSRRTLYNWLENKDFKAEYDEQLRELDRKIRQRISCMANKALDRQEDILENSTNDSAAASVAADILDRAGYKPESKKDRKGASSDDRIADKLNEIFNHVIE